MGVQVLPCAPSSMEGSQNGKCEARPTRARARVVETPALGQARLLVETSHGTETTCPTVQWRNGNAAVCKTAMSRLDTGLRLHCLDSSMDRAPVF